MFELKKRLLTLTLLRWDWLRRDWDCYEETADSYAVTLRLITKRLRLLRRDCWLLLLLRGLYDFSRSWPEWKYRQVHGCLWLQLRFVFD